MTRVNAVTNRDYGCSVMILRSRMHSRMCRFCSQICQWRLRGWTVMAASRASQNAEATAIESSSAPWTPVAPSLHAQTLPQVCTCATPRTYIRFPPAFHSPGRLHCTFQLCCISALATSATQLFCRPSCLHSSRLHITADMHHRSSSAYMHVHPHHSDAPDQLEI